MATIAETKSFEQVSTATPLLLLYDGHCRFCTRSAEALARRVGRGRIQPRDFQEEGALATFPGVTYEACMKRMHLVHPDGRVFAGAEAVARAFATLRGIGWLFYLYYVPGVRQLAELAYRVIAKHRYRLFGRREACDGGTCSLHG